MRELKKTKCKKSGDAGPFTVSCWPLFEIMSFVVLLSSSPLSSPPKKERNQECFFPCQIHTITIAYGRTKLRSLGAEQRSGIYEDARKKTESRC